MAAFVALVAAAWSGSAVAQQPSTPTPPSGATPASTNTPAATSACAIADAFVATGETGRARRAYVRVLLRSPTEPCAITGLKALNARQLSTPPSCADADQQLADGDLDAAGTSYATLAAQGASCAAAGLKKVATLQRLCDEGDVLVQRHREADALTVYESALAKNPHVTCAQDGIDHASGTTWAGRSVDATIAVATRAVEVIGMLVVVGLLLLLLAYVPKLGDGIRRLPGARAILSPRLKLDAFTNEPDNTPVGAPLAARIKEHLQAAREEAVAGTAPDYDLDVGRPGDDFANLVSGDSGLSNALGQAREISDHTKVVTAIVDLVLALLPIRRLTVTGVFEPAGSDGAAVCLTLEDNGAVRAATRLASRSADGDGTVTAEHYLRLASPAAVWVQYEVAQTLRGAPSARDAAESYALTREAIDRQQGGEIELARRAYQDAISLNPHNWSARANLAVIEAHAAEAMHDLQGAVAATADALEQMLEEESA